MLRALVLVLLLVLAPACRQEPGEPGPTEASPPLSKAPLQLEGEADFQLEGIVARASIQTEPAGQANPKAWGRLHVLAKSIGQPVPGCPSVQEEVEILQMLAVGLSPQKISERLSIKLSTTRTHINNILRKTETQSALDAIVYGVRSGLIR